MFAGTACCAPTTAKAKSVAGSKNSATRRYKVKAPIGRLAFFRLMRGARPGKPGRQTAGASSRTPQEVPECARQMVDK